MVKCDDEWSLLMDLVLDERGFDDSISRCSRVEPTDEKARRHRHLGL